MYSIEELRNLIKHELELKNYVETPATLFEPIEYILDDGGKRLRPVLLLMAYNLFKEDVDKAIKSAIGIEIFHNYTLLHDDVMDNAELRRGRMTVHKKWNTNVAILSGDAAAITAYKYMEHCDDKHLRRAISGFNQMAMDICKGQQYDMEFETRDDVTEDEYLHMIYLKTSVLLAGAMRHGALIADAPESDYNALYDFGGNLGMAFQLQDDLLDVYGDEKTFGKKIGGDITINKKTYLLINAKNKAHGADLDELNGWIARKTFDAPEKIAAVTAIYNRLGIREKTQNAISQYLEKSIRSLDCIQVPRERKAAFYDMVEKLRNRNH